MPKSFTFTAGPDDMIAELHRYTGGPNAGKAYISFSGKGPRGGYVYGASMIPPEALDQLAELIAEAKKGA